MKIVSWNINGLKSILENNFEENIKSLNADVVCIQETKITKPLKNLKLDEYNTYFNYSSKGGYAGVAIFSKEKAINVYNGMEFENEYGEFENIDYESRVITIEFNDFYVVSVYVPCSQLTTRRTNKRMEFDENFYKYIGVLNNKKDVIICGDFNISYQNIDICDLSKRKKIEFFEDEERANFRELLELGFIDTYRYMHSQMRKYTFWTNDVKDRVNCEVGWRIDYILVSEYLRKNIREANILTEIPGSDHCPIELVLKV